MARIGPKGKAARPPIGRATRLSHPWGPEHDHVVLGDFWPIGEGFLRGLAGGLMGLEWPKIRACLFLSPVSFYLLSLSISCLYLRCSSFRGLEAETKGRNRSSPPQHAESSRSCAWTRRFSWQIDASPDQSVGCWRLNGPGNPLLVPKPPPPPIQGIRGGGQWSRSGSNRQPPRCDRGALPIELRPQEMGLDWIPPTTAGPRIVSTSWAGG